MKALVDTINSIDENSKKILFKHFDHNNVNIMQQKFPDLMLRNNRAKFESEDCYGINSDEMDSDSSGNNSQTDEINRM
jgi:hypothetical protein